MTSRAVEGGFSKTATYAEFRAWLEGTSSADAPIPADERIAHGRAAVAEAERTQSWMKRYRR